MDREVGSGNHQPEMEADVVLVFRTLRDGSVGSSLQDPPFDTSAACRKPKDFSLMEISDQGRLSVPYPVLVSEPIIVNRADVVIAFRGLAATADEISFVVHVAVSADEDFQAQGVTLSAGRPFNMPHETPDPESLTVRCRWQLKGNGGDGDDTECVDTWGKSPLDQGSWSLRPDTGVWIGFFLLCYPVPVSEIETFTIEMSWNHQGIEAVQRTVTASALGDALAFASSQQDSRPAGS